MTNKYCGDLRRRRIRAKTAQKKRKILARETPYCQDMQSFLPLAVASQGSHAVWLAVFFCWLGIRPHHCLHWQPGCLVLGEVLQQQARLHVDLGPPLISITVMCFICLYNITIIIIITNSSSGGGGGGSGSSTAWAMAPPLGEPKRRCGLGCYQTVPANNQ